MTIATYQSVASSPRVQGGVRPFLEADIDQVTALHRRVSGFDDRTATANNQMYRTFFSDVFPPAQAPADLGSLVYQNRNGSIVGFQGVRSRRMLFEDRAMRMAVCSHFIVDPDHRGVPGVRILDALMQGPQDLTLADESNDTARRLWEWCGGTTALLYSMHWLRPLRLSEAAVGLFLKRKSPGVARLASSLARSVDAFCNRFAFHPLRTFAPRGSRHPLDPATLTARFAEIAGDRALRPDYGDGTLGWILERARTRNAGGDFRMVAVSDEKGEMAGWYIYFANRGAIGEVLQIAARPRMAGLVLDHLIDDGMQSGVVALAGRLDPVFAHELSERHCILYRRGHWALIHSRSRKVLQAIERGDAFLSRLEGEWCLRLQ